MSIKKPLFALAFILLGSFVFSSPLRSPVWGFELDLPVCYVFAGGDGRDRFSFQNHEGARFDLIVYPAEGDLSFASAEALALDVQMRLNNMGGFESFVYRRKNAVMMRLSFTLPGVGPMSGWALIVELAAMPTAMPAAMPTVVPGARPLLLAMAYGPAGRNDLYVLHFSALDSIVPEAPDRFFPGPVTEFSFPRQTRVQRPIYGLGINAYIFAEDAEAAQTLIDREFMVLRRFQDDPNWQEAWKRFYRAIYRDSFDRVIDIAFQVERHFNVPAKTERDFAEQVLRWVQTFEYERDLDGSDFINLVSAATEGRGDCDNRSVLWAIILRQAGIPSAIMVSRNHSHAMGLADIPGPGARFPMGDQHLLVAETTVNVSIGLINERMSDIGDWLGILFE